MKLLVSVFIAVSILTTTSISSYAIALDDKTANSNISLYYETAQKTYSSLKISGNTANCYSYAIANTKCTNAGEKTIFSMEECTRSFLEHEL